MLYTKSYFSKKVCIFILQFDFHVRYFPQGGGVSYSVRPPSTAVEPRQGEAAVPLFFGGEPKTEKKRKKKANNTKT